MKRYFAILSLMLGFVLTATAQTITVTGTVIDDLGEPLPGATVIVKDAKGLGTTTDIDGKYSIKVEQYKTLVFSYMGFESQEFLVKDQKVIDVKMAESKVSAMDEVVVTGMQAQKKLTLTGAITNVKMEELKHFNTSNLTNTLAGNVAGVMAYQKSGQPGKNTSEFWIRGISTFGASSSAYILVDGFERDNLDDINIEDIESFSVLKDASATAIYGSKGANGVVLITTKHGKAGKVNINAKVETSYNTRTITPEFVDGFQYASLLNEARVTRNLGVLYQPVELEIIRNNLDPNLYPNVDWQDILLKDGAMSYRANLNISGGGETARYYVSMAYTQDEGMYKTDQTLRDKYDTNANFNRWNYRMNVDVDVTKTTLLKFGISGNLNKRNSPGIGDDKVWGQMFGYNPLYTPTTYVAEDGSGMVYYPAKGVYTEREENGETIYELDENYINPWVSSTQTGYNTEWQNNIQTNITLEQNLDFITKGLRFTGRFGFDTYNNNSIQHHRLPALYSARSRNTETGLLDFQMVQTARDMTQSSANDGSRREFLDLLLHWDRQFWDYHNFAANVKFTEDQNISTQNLGTDIKNSVSRKNKGLAAQVTYNFASRYFADFNFGYNGSENFADGHRWGFFPAWSVAWNIGEEPWVKNNVKWLDMFKVRFSNGRVGSDATGSSRFPYLYTLEASGDGYTWGANGQNSYGSVRYRQVSSDYVTWEVATKNDLGIDLVLFNNKFSLTMDYFDEERTGIFQERRFLPTTVGLEYWDSNGMNYPKANVGSVRSRGFDGNFSYNDKFGDVGVTVRGNITYSKNEIGEYDEENNVYAYQNQHGYRVNQERGLIALGLFKDYDDIRNSPTQEFGTVQPGDIKYKDVNGDGVVNDGDVCAIGATSRPSLIYGLGFTITYKGFDFNVHLQGAGKSTFPTYGKCVWVFSENQWGNVFKGTLDNRWVDSQTAAQLGIAANEDPNATYPRLSYGGNSNNDRNSTFWLRDGRYLRLKNVDIGYTLPKRIVNRIHFQNVRFYVSASNLLFLYKKFDTWDPESLQPRGEDYPITKAITAGLQVNI
ncbi:MAG: TonB-dependent receptor [Bacteroidaceae bacterium]|nr:TonB-dependent receptor [Bacteroidaceae bacterium]